jgi:hypothetical protein
MATLNKYPGPRRQIPMCFYPEEMHLNALPRARPGSKGKVRSKGGRPTSRARMNQPRTTNRAEIKSNYSIIGGKCQEFMLIDKQKPIKAQQFLDKYISE